MDKFFQWAAGQPRHLARVGARLPHLARGNEVLALDYQSRPGGDPKTWDGSAACGYVDSETAQAMVTVAGVSRKGRRLGRWLAWEEARTLLKTADPHSIRGMRDRALLAVLVACALRRGELSRMNCEHLALRDGRWVFWISWEREIRRDRWRCRCGWSKQSMGGSRRRELRTSAAAAGQVCLCVVHSVAEGSLGW
jgi:integrase